MPAETKVIVGIGEILWDVFPSGKRLGGAPANFAYHVREIGGGGMQSLAVSCVGEDPPGREILARWDELSLSGEFIAVDAHHPTGMVSVAVDPQGKPVYDIKTDVAWDFLPESPQLRELASTAAAVCFGTLAQRAPRSRKSIRDFLRHAGSGALRILDINLRSPFFSPRILEESLSLANVLKLNADELHILAGTFSISGGDAAVVHALMRRFALRMVALTRGERGSELYSAGGGRSTHGGYPVAVADTVGAGDAFTAAIAAGMLGGFPLEKLNECANRAASFVCTQAGAMPKVPEEIKKLFW
jgi:fructokinase